MTYASGAGKVYDARFIFQGSSELLNLSKPEINKINALLSYIKRGVNYINIQRCLGYSDEAGTKVYIPERQANGEYVVVEETNILNTDMVESEEKPKEDEFSVATITEILSSEITSPERLEPVVIAVYRYLNGKATLDEFEEDKSICYEYYVKFVMDELEARAIVDEREKAKIKKKSEKDGFTSNTMLFVLSGFLVITWIALMVMDFRI